MLLLQTFLFPLLSFDLGDNLPCHLVIDLSFALVLDYGGHCFGQYLQILLPFLHPSLRCLQFEIDQAVNTVTFHKGLVRHGPNILLFLLSLLFLCGLLVLLFLDGS